MKLETININELGFLATVSYTPFVDKDGNLVNEIRYVQLPHEASKWTRSQILQYIKNSFKSPSISNLDIDTEFTETKEVFFDQLRQGIDDWKRIQDVRIEAQAKGLTAIVIKAIEELENNRWQVVVGLLQKWRAAT